MLAHNSNEQCLLNDMCPPEEINHVDNEIEYTTLNK